MNLTENLKRKVELDDIDGTTKNNQINIICGFWANIVRRVKRSIPDTLFIYKQR